MSPPRPNPFDISKWGYWWAKAVEMLVHNWALIEESQTERERERSRFIFSMTRARLKAVALHAILKALLIRLTWPRLWIP